jgi:hypothetical protein
MTGGVSNGHAYDAKIIVKGQHFKHPPFKIDQFDNEEVVGLNGRIDYINGYGVVLTGFVQQDWIDGLVKAELLGTKEVLVTVPQVPFHLRERFSASYRQVAETHKLPKKLLDEQAVDNATLLKMKEQNSESVVFRFLLEFPVELSVDEWNAPADGSKGPRPLEDHPLRGGFKVEKGDRNKTPVDTATWIIAIAGTRRPKKNPKAQNKAKRVDEMNDYFEKVNLDDDFDDESIDVGGNDGNSEDGMF